MYNPIYVGLGGNVGNSEAILRQAIQEIQALCSCEDLRVSRYFWSTPVSPIPQPNYCNAVCTFSTSLSLRSLYSSLQDIEKKMGKKSKPKNAPRILDLDLLFFGKESCEDADLRVPHPHWRERLFVLRPFLDLTKEIELPCGTKINLETMVRDFSNIHQEIVVPVEV